MSSLSNYSAIYSLLGGFLIGTGLILILVELIQDADEWTLRIIGISAMLIGLILIILYIKCEKKYASIVVCNGNGSAPATTPTPLKFVKVEVPGQVHILGKQVLPMTQRSPNWERNNCSANRIRRSISPEMFPARVNHTSEKPPVNQIEHYKPRHFAGHGYRTAAQLKSAPLAMQEDITPSLRSSYNSLYLLEHSSDSESDTSSYNSMIYLP